MSKFGGEDYEGIGSVMGVESCKIVLLGAFPIHLFKHFCCKMYRLATVHSVTNRRTDDSMMPLANHTVCSSTIS